MPQGFVNAAVVLPAPCCQAIRPIASIVAAIVGALCAAIAAPTPSHNCFPSALNVDGTASYVGATLVADGLSGAWQEVGSDTWIRTRDPLINSQLLYR